MLTTTMHAIHVHAYGDTNQLQLEQISQPTPQEGEVLVHCPRSRRQCPRLEDSLGLNEEYDAIDISLQFAHCKGAQVITTTSTSNVAFVQALGADRVIDYTKMRVENEVQNVDLVFDTVGGEAAGNALTTLKSGGMLLTTVGQPNEKQAQTLGAQTSFFSARLGETVGLLTTVSHLIDEGQLRTSIAATFSLSKASKAHELSQSEHGRGRIILHIA